MRRCIDTAARHSGFILSTSCEIPPRSDPEIVKWFMDAAHEYGRYDRIFRRGRARDDRLIVGRSPPALDVRRSANATRGPACLALLISPAWCLTDCGSRSKR